MWFDKNKIEDIFVLIDNQGALRIFAKSKDSMFLLCTFQVDETGAGISVKTLIERAKQTEKEKQWKKNK